ncbi:MAG: hypothetical protein DCC71_00750 [Proteobacteria bacterium]|nr:MAG: hypothetical protein DCC71_00750 [Pseudomonadota bacterium]
MRGVRGRDPAAVFVFWLLLPWVAVAEGAAVEIEAARRRFGSIEARVREAETQLRAVERRIASQQALLESAALAEGRGDASGLAGFWQRVHVGGWLSASYLYSLNDPDDAANCADVLGAPSGSRSECGFAAGGLANTLRGASGRLGLISPDHNSFSFEQAWLELEHAATEEHRGGFRIDWAYGKTAGLAWSEGVANRSEARDDTGFYIFQTYAQYLLPFGFGGEDTLLKAGAFYTHIGVEALQTVWNWNITRSNVWSLMEPSNHLGVQASGAIGESGFDWMFGVVNGFWLDDPDRNDGKTLTAHLGWTGETVAVSANAIWGPEQLGFDGDQSGVAHLLLRWDPTERFATYLSADYGWAETAGDPWGIGVAWAARLALTDRTGIAVRADWAHDGDRYFGLRNERGEPTDAHVWSLTATLDHRLTSHFMLRGELRWDAITKEDGPDGEFFRGKRYRRGLDDDQVLVAVEAIYHFNGFGN